MQPNPYAAIVIPEKEPPKKTFSWITFFIVLLGGQFLYTWHIMVVIAVDHLRASIIMAIIHSAICLAAMATAKLATKL